MSRVTLNFPKELEAELKAAAKRNYRTFTAEVIARCVEYTSNVHTLGIHQASPPQTPAAQQMSIVHTPDVSHTASVHTPDISQASVAWPATDTDTPLERAEAYDALPNDGDFRNAASNFRVRRGKQLECLQDAWKEMWPEASPLLKDNAIRYLQLSDNSAVEVLSAFMAAETKGIKGKDAGLRRYIETVLKNRKAEREKPQQAKPTGKPYGDSSGWVIRPPTPEEEAEDAEARRIMMERGLWSPDDAA